jgi:GT2 family glycosyltransferase
MQGRRKSTNKKDKCDVIIPIYNAPEWVKLCVYSVFINTPQEYLGKVLLMNDNSDSNTVELLYNLKDKYPEKIEIISNEANLGFVKNSNKGIANSHAEYLLLLNSDCLISKNTIPKLISHLKKNKNIGLISPVASNAANLTLEIFEGFSYTQMDALLEKKFKGMNFDAVTIVGNCLMITRECINRVGLLDEAYGMGYGEETDYQFKAMEKGFQAKVAIDTYVYHHKEASFGHSKQKEEKVAQNRKLFFERWGDIYDELLKVYSENDPIEYIKKNLTEEDKQISIDTLFFLPVIFQNAGGCHMVVDIVNYLVINGEKANILYSVIQDYHETMLFKPIPEYRIEEILVKQIVATIWITSYIARRFAATKKIPLINFVQGNENYFENGLVTNYVDLTYKIADYSLTISTYLYNRLRDMNIENVEVIKNSVNYDLLSHVNKSRKAKRVTFILRDNIMKGDFILLDIIKQLDKKVSGLEFNVVYLNERTQIPNVRNNKIIKVQGPISRLRMTDLLKNTDIYVDASLNEGFGLIALEAMVCGAVPIASNSFGNLDYMHNGKNGFLIEEINNVDKYVEKIVEIIENREIYSSMKEKCREVCREFDIDLAIKKYIEYFSATKERVLKTEYSKVEIDLIDEIENKILVPSGHLVARDKRILYRISPLIPQKVKSLLKPIITYLYNMYEK